MAQNVNDLAHQIGSPLMQRGWTVATAESCTGGLIGHLITDVAGSSAYYVGGIVAYSNTIKHDQLGVPQSTLDSVGAVSEPTARAMAAGVRDRLGTSVGIATTGIAGPGGGTATKPVGLVYICVETPDQTICQRHVFDGDRHAVKQQTAENALQILIHMLS